MALGKQDPVHNSEKGYTSVPRWVMLFRMASCSYHIVCRLSCKYNPLVFRVSLTLMQWVPLGLCTLGALTKTIFR